MGIEKTAVKLATLNTIGNELDDSLEAAKIALAQVEGQITFSAELGKLVESLTKAIDNDIDAGKVPIDEPLIVARYVKEYILRAKKLLEDAGIRAVHARHEHKGRITAWEQAIKKVKKHHQAQVSKLKALELALNQEAEALEGESNVVPLRGRVEGQHPGASLKARRLAEESAITKVNPKKGTKKPKVRKKRKPANAKD